MNRLQVPIIVGGDARFLWATWIIAAIAGRVALVKETATTTVSVRVD